MENKKIHTQWTPEQENAIKSRCADILVSAAAGSGKTAVLTQRIVEILLDEEKPCNADELLVVTFTKAAASEMKQRIEVKIDNLIREKPQNKRLKRQKSLLKIADISTIHSFCNKLIKENFYVLGLNPDFNIAQEFKINLLKQKVIEEILDNKYKEENNSDFIKLVNIFSINKDDSKFVEIINILYNYVRSHPFMDRWFKERINLYNSDLSIKETVFYKIILDYVSSCLEYSVLIYEDLIDLISKDAKTKDLFYSALSLELEFFKDLKFSLYKKSVHENLRKLEVFNFSTLKRFPRNYNNDYLKLKIKNNRAKVKKIVEEIKNFLNIDEKEYADDSEKIKKIVSGLFSILREYIEKLDALKKEENILDFSDLEHYVLKLLVKETKTGYIKTKIANELSKKYKYIMVDECQDINETQNMIFNAVSKNSKNLFMVGDVKQSIYGFRQAMPEIFLNKKENSVPYVLGQEDASFKITLSKNFRSKKGILDFINFVFKNLMRKKLGGIDYDDEEKLYYGSNYENLKDSDVDLRVLNLKNAENKDMDLNEALYIVKLIRDLIESKYKVKDKDTYRNIEYRDICILLRNANKHIGNFRDILNLASIPVSLKSAESFLCSKEITTILDLLLVISNPLRDTNLFSVMLNNSYFGFTLDDILSIRKKDKNTSLYYCVTKSAKEGNFKAIKLIKKIDEYQTLSLVLGITEFLDYIYKDTSYIYALNLEPDSNIKINNLKLLMHYAKEYENSQRSGIDGFCEYLSSLKEQNIDLQDSSFLTSFEDNSVKIMSVHQSKGLEFPVCILANFKRKLNKDSEDILLHPKLGVGIKLLDEKRGVKYSNFQREAIKIAILNSSVAEEIRVLYVALTRAKQKLIMISSLKDADKTLENLALEVSSFKKDYIPTYFILKTGSYSDLICSLVLKSTLAKKLLNGALAVNASDIENKEYLENFDAQIINVPEKIDVDKLQKLNINKVSSKISVDVNEEDLLKKLESIKESDTKPKIKIPSKISVTDILNTMQSEKGKDDIYKLNINELDIKASDSLYFKKDKDILSLCKNIEQGNILHEFIKIIDFKKAAKDFNLYINDLIKMRVITDSELKKINLDLIKKFLESDLVKRILKSSKVLKEYDFSVFLPVSELFNLYENLCNMKKEVELKGTIDCAFLENDSYVIVDYKLGHLDKTNKKLESYKNQLKLYKYALEKYTNIKVKECVLYSLVSGKTLILEF